MSEQRYAGGILREQWDDTTRLYTSWNASGVQTSQRPYTTQENATADAAALVTQQSANKSSVQTNLAQDFAALQAIIDDTNANINTNPAQRIKDIAKAVRRLTRIALGDYSGTS